jgi:hypothetical protein
MTSGLELGGVSDAPALIAPSRSLRFRQTVVVLLMFGGYGALYFCRADLSVATPMLIEELGRRMASAMPTPSFAWVPSRPSVCSPMRWARFS